MNKDVNFLPPINEHLIALDVLNLLHDLGLTSINTSFQRKYARQDWLRVLVQTMGKDSQWKN